MPDNMLVDYITGKIVPDTAKENVRQHIARALFHEYEISVDDMARDFPIDVETDGRKRRRRIDIAIFEPGDAHPGEPPPGGDLQAGAEGGPHRHQASAPTSKRRRTSRSSRPCSGRRRPRRLQLRHVDQRGRLLLPAEKTDAVRSAKFEPRATGRSRTSHRQRGTVASVAPGCAAARPRCSRRPSAAATTTSTATRACRRTRPSGSSSTCCSPRCTMSGEPAHAARRQFYVLPARAVHRRRAARRSGERIEALFDEVKKKYRRSSGRSDELTLSDRALAFIVGELAPYNLTGTDADVKGIAYQELVGDQPARRPRPVLHAAGRRQAHGGHPRPEGGRDGPRPGLRHRRLPP